MRESEPSTAMDYAAPTSGATARFVWPPAPDAPADVAPPFGTVDPAETSPGAGARAHGGAIARLIREAEAFWLAPVAVPLARRMEDGGWSPDGLAAFCNRCAQSIGVGEDEFGCARCRGRRLPWSRAVRLGEYDGELGAWVREVKFARNASLGVDLGRLLASQLRESGLAAGTAGARVCVVPIPLSRGGRLWRGIDHARCIAEGVAKGLGAPLVGGLVRRRGPSQRSMPTVRARERNARGMFRAAWGVDLRGWTVVLVDDVMTTGATMRAAGKALRGRSGEGRPASVWAAAVGVTPDRARRGGADVDGKIG